MTTSRARKLTNAEVALALGVHHSYVSRMRSGDRVASVSTLATIAEVYGVSVTELVAAARRASNGDTKRWVELLDRAFTTQDEPIAV